MELRRIWIECWIFVKMDNIAVFEFRDSRDSGANVVSGAVVVKTWYRSFVKLWCSHCSGAVLICMFSNTFSTISRRFSKLVDLRRSSNIIAALSRTHIDSSIVTATCNTTSITPSKILCETLYETNVIVDASSVQQVRAPIPMLVVCRCVIGIRFGCATTHVFLQRQRKKMRRYSSVARVRSGRLL